MFKERLDSERMVRDGPLLSKEKHGPALANNDKKRSAVIYWSIQRLERQPHVATKNRLIVFLSRATSDREVWFERWYLRRLSLLSKSLFLLHHPQLFISYLVPSPVSLFQSDQLVFSLLSLPRHSLHLIVNFVYLRPHSLCRFLLASPGDTFLPSFKVLNLPNPRRPRPPLPPFRSRTQEQSLLTPIPTHFLNPNFLSRSVASISPSFGSSSPHFRSPRILRLVSQTRNIQLRALVQRNHSPSCRAQTSVRSAPLSL